MIPVTLLITVGLSLFLILVNDILLTVFDVFNLPIHLPTGTCTSLCVDPVSYYTQRLYLIFGLNVFMTSKVFPHIPLNLFFTTVFKGF